MYEPTPAESDWARASARPAAAVLCVPAAAAVNRLDADLIAPLLAEGSSARNEIDVGAWLGGRHTINTISRLQSA